MGRKGGFKHSEETKEKIRKFNLGKKLSKETKRKLSKVFTGRRCSIETRRKLSESMKGKKHPNWKGGQTISGGRVYIWKPSHPKADGSGYLKRAHIVWENYWRELLPKGYLIHHVDRNRVNDDITNLALVTKSLHNKIHNQKRKPYQKRKPC